MRKKTVVSKKTSRSPKSASPAQPPEATKKAPSQAAVAAPKAAGRAPKKTAAAKPARPVVTRRKAMVVSDEEVRIRAYFLSLEYRGSDQNDVDFWLLAERELRPAKTPGKP